MINNMLDYNDSSIDFKDINTYLKIENDDDFVTIEDVSIYSKMENDDDFVTAKDINTYLKMKNDDDTINYIFQTYDQFHPEFKKLIDIFNFGIEVFNFGDD